jgi:hypothetical protein
MGNASDRMDGSEGYGDEGEPGRPLGRRWPGSKRLVTRWVRQRRSERERHDAHGAW